MSRYATLSDAQRFALIRLQELTDAANTNTGNLPPQTRFDTSRICRSVVTAFALEDRGLVKVRGGYVLGRYEAELTNDGRTLAETLD